MTREEQIKKQADIYTDDTSNYAEWSDDGWSDTNDIKLIEKAFIKGAKWADKTMIDMQDRKVIKNEKINWYAKLDLFNDNEKTLFNGVIATIPYKINKNIENVVPITQSIYDKILKTGTIKLRVWKDRYPDKINCYEWHVFKVEKLYMETLTVEEIKI